MTDQQLLERITINRKVMVGKPVIKGTRLPVEYVLNLLAHGAAVAEILDEYQGLIQEDIQACLLFATRSLENTAFMPLATDVDGDGDIDVLSASQLDDKIAWYENMTPTCGNGAVRLGEECDDGNTNDGDGCSAICTVEQGWNCTGKPSVCTSVPIPTVSEWGLIVMTLLVLTAGTLVYARRRPIHA